MAFGFGMEVTTDDGLKFSMEPLQPSDSAKIAAGMQSYELARTLGLPSAQTERDEDEWFERCRIDDASVMWSLRFEGEPIGITSLHRKPSRYSSGSLIFRRDLWGKKIAKSAHRARCYYAVHVLDLLAIESEVLFGNTASIKALLSAGYTEIGIEPAAWFRAGERKHMHRLLWVNPTDRSWNYFWGDAELPPTLRRELLRGRERATEAIRWAEAHVTFM